MFGHDAGAPKEIDLMIEAQAEGRRLGVAANQRAIRVRIHDRVSDHVNFCPGKRLQNRMQLVEGDPFRVHQGVQFIRREVRRRGLDDMGRGINDVAWGEQNFSAIAFQCFLLLPGPGMQAFFAVLISFGKVIRLDNFNVFDWRGIFIDDHVIHHFQNGEVHGAQILRHEGTEIGLMNVRVSGQAGDQDVRFALGIDEVSDMAGVDEVEGPVTHDGLFSSGQRSKNLAQCLRR